MADCTRAVVGRKNSWLMLPSSWHMPLGLTSLRMLQAHCMRSCSWPKPVIKIEQLLPVRGAQTHLCACDGVGCHNECVCNVGRQYSI